MSVSRKYGRTYHYPFSPGTTSDDRINEPAPPYSGHAVEKMIDKLEVPRDWEAHRVKHIVA